jgi:hypothetical protein
VAVRRTSCPEISADTKQLGGLGLGGLLDGILGNLGLTKLLEGLGLGKVTGKKGGKGGKLLGILLDRVPPSWRASERGERCLSENHEFVSISPRFSSQQSDWVIYEPPVAK